MATRGLTEFPAWRRRVLLTLALCVQETQDPRQIDELVDIACQALPALGRVPREKIAAALMGEEATK